MRLTEPNAEAKPVAGIKAHRFFSRFCFKDVRHEIDITARCIRNVITEIPHSMRHISQYHLQIGHVVRLKFAKTIAVMLTQIGDIQFGSRLPIGGSSGFVSDRQKRSKCFQVFVGERLDYLVSVNNRLRRSSREP